MFWFFQNFPPIQFGGRQGPVHWSGAFEVAAWTSGHAMFTPAINTMALLDWMEADGMVGDLRDIDFSDLVKSLPKIPHIMKLLRAWAATKEAHELFLTAKNAISHLARSRRLPKPHSARNSKLADSFAALMGTARTYRFQDRCFVRSRLQAQHPNHRQQPTLSALSFSAGRVRTPERINLKLLEPRQLVTNPSQGHAYSTLAGSWPVHMRHVFWLI